MRLIHKLYIKLIKNFSLIKIKYLFIIFLLSPFLIFIVLIKPIVLIRIGNLVCERIGSFSNAELYLLINKFKKKVIACICSGAQLLISAKVVKGRKISGYYRMKDDLVNAGATYTDLPAVIDHNIVTTAHYKDLGPWMKAVLKVFYDKHKNQS